MNYNEALEYIHNTNRFGSKLGLKNMQNLLNSMGNPQNKLKFIHIAGTNGKGSTSMLLHNILKEQGYRVGLFISPYLEQFTERIQINGVHIKKEVLADLTQKVKNAIDQMVANGLQHPTEFEIVTAIGFLYFEVEKVDIVVLEVGLGGRLDATNIISNAELSIITAIGQDHTMQLGNTLEEIAAEKAGIIKENGRVVVYPQSDKVEEVIRQIAIKRKADLYLAKKEDINILESSLQGQVFSYKGKNLFLPRVEMKLLGRHQIYNAATTLKALEVLNKRNFTINQEAIIAGFNNTVWAGRFEIVSKEPCIILDGAHNSQGAQAFYKAMQEYFPKRKIILFLGILVDKNIDEILEFFLPIASEVITLTPNNPRAMEAEVLAEKIKVIDTNVKVQSMNTIDEAVYWAKKCKPEKMIAFTGSLYLIGDVRSKIL